MDGDALHLVCASDRAFARHTATMLASVVKNASQRSHVYWLHIGLDDAFKRTITQFLRDGACVSFFDVDTRDVSDLLVDKHASVANYFRLLIGGFIPANVDKVIYLDSDLIVRRDLTELWSIDLGKSAIGACIDPTAAHASQIGLDEADYFNSGVLLIDMQAWRDQKIGEQCLSIARANRQKLDYWDQDALNIYFFGKWKRLPIIWNMTHRYFEGEQVSQEPAIVHFTGWGLKPWEYGGRWHPFRNEYYFYRSQTPWPKVREAGVPLVYERAMKRIRKLQLKQ